MRKRNPVSLTAGGDFLFLSTSVFASTQHHVVYPAPNGESAALGCRSVYSIFHYTHNDKRDNSVDNRKPNCAFLWEGSLSNGVSVDGNGSGINRNRENKALHNNNDPCNRSAISCQRRRCYVILLLTVCELPLWLKVAVVGGANLIGVYVVKLIEEKSRKDKLWKVEATILRGHTTALHCNLVDAEISHNYLENVGKYTLFNIFCETQSDSLKAKEILNKYNAKYFVSESKAL